MPKHIPESVKTEAMKLFLDGDKTAKEIAKILSVDDISVQPSTIYSWAKRQKWGQQKSVARADERQKLAESEGQKFARIQKEHLDNYDIVTRKAYEELDDLRFDKAFDAVKALDIGIKGQREVISGLINLQFVQDIMSILVEEIEEQDLLNRIAIKMKTLVQQNQGETT